MSNAAFKYPEGWKVERNEVLRIATIVSVVGCSVTIDWDRRTFHPGRWTPYPALNERGGVSVYAGRGWKDAIQRDACAFLKDLRWV